ncbi:glycosyltransferase family 2 protein [Agromyces albus]|uniref:Glycosyltransferase family 2 protein n=1 Tax=Agromyces albus TaxID=205332 RepID=A0A4Q2L703_9MICO|nr:glycosyltransferase family 2 protein [Agromyces albus]RXZ72071.1 glycosyltransferase family 2 protein [Agromyces albus]
MTMMVRDEADIIRATLEHHRAQGVDRIIVTDNGSVDGTTEILEEFASDGLVDLRFDPVHQKQQSEVVTAMARAAYTEYGADWVINADADEFWVARNPARTIRGVFENTPRAFQTFLVPVIDMTGTPALEGAGLGRLVYRDARTVDELRSLGLLAHSTPDAVHIGSPDIEVAQGNHAVSFPSRGTPARDDSLEVLHLPWRSWGQYSRKVEAAGRAYTSAGAKRPSPNHHGMLDYARMQAGMLEGFYLIRHPDAARLESGLADGTFILDDRLTSLAHSGKPDVPYDEERRNREIARVAPLARAEGLLFERSRQIEELTVRAEAAEDRIPPLEHALADALHDLHEVRSRRLVQFFDRLTNTVVEIRQKRSRPRPTDSDDVTESN